MQHEEALQGSHARPPLLHLAGEALAPLHQTALFRRRVAWVRVRARVRVRVRVEEG